MTLKADADALTDRFRVQWTALRPTVPVAWDNAPAIDPQPTAAFVRFAVRQGDVRRGHIGSGVGPYEAIGRVIVQVFAPKNDGTSLADALADDVLTIFRRWRSSDGAVRVDNGEVAAIPGDANWHQVNVSLPYVSWRNL